VKSIESGKHIYLTASDLNESFRYMINLCYGDRVKFINISGCNKYFLDYWADKNEKSVSLKKIDDMFQLSAENTDHMAFYTSRF
jgi:hypothetical protein